MNDRIKGMINYCVVETCGSFTARTVSNRNERVDPLRQLDTNMKNKELSF